MRRTYCIIGISLHAVAAVDIFEYLVVVDETTIFVVDDDFKAEVSLLPHKEALFVPTK